MLEALNEGEASPAQLARRFGEAVNLVAYHMRILAQAGAVELVRTEPRRGSVEHYYRATMRPTFADREWARLPLETRRAVLDAEVNKILRDIRAAAGSSGFEHPKAHVSWTALDLDREGIDEVAELLAGVVGELLDIQARAAGRQSTRQGAKESLLPTEVAMLHFERRPRGRRPAPGAQRSPNP